jgi:hypothetical protein
MCQRAKNGSMSALLDASPNMPALVSVATHCSRWFGGTLPDRRNCRRIRPAQEDRPDVPQQQSRAGERKRRENRYAILQAGVIDGSSTKRDPSSFRMDRSNHKQANLIDAAIAPIAKSSRFRLRFWRNWKAAEWTAIFSRERSKAVGKLSIKRDRIDKVVVDYDLEFPVFRQAQFGLESVGNCLRAGEPPAPDPRQDGCCYSPARWGSNNRGLTYADRNDQTAWQSAAPPRLVGGRETAGSRSPGQGPLQQIGAEGVDVVGIGIGVSGSDPALKVNLRARRRTRDFAAEDDHGVWSSDFVGKITPR